jgi:hypothetical protein
MQSYQDATDKFFTKLFGKLVKSKVFGNISSGLKQMATILSYSEDVGLPKGEEANGEKVSFAAELMKALKNSKETKAYMDKIDYVSKRIDEENIQDLIKNSRTGAIERALDQTKLKNIFNWFDLLKWGDAFSVRFGGYAQIQANRKLGMSESDAIKTMIDSTRRTQQSNLRADKGIKGMQTDIASQMLNVFNSQTIGMSNKIKQTIIEWQKGEIATGQVMNFIANKVAQIGLMIVIKALFLPDDKNKGKQLKDEALLNLSDNLLGDNIFFANTIIHSLIDKQNGASPFNVFFFEDIDKFLRANIKAMSESKNFTMKDFMNLIDFPFSTTLGASPKILMRSFNFVANPVKKLLK